MAKWGEGDPRWIVEERADATNVNNWHWTEKNATEWSKVKLKELLKSVAVVEPLVGEFTISDVLKLDGEASLNNRKSKIIYFYEWDITLQWEGTLIAEGEFCKGTCVIPNLSDENDADDLDVGIYLDEEYKQYQKTKEWVIKKSVPLIKDQLVKYVNSLKEEFGADMIKPVEIKQKPAVDVMKTPNIEDIKQSDKQQMKASAVGVKLSSSKAFKLTERFQTTPSDLYSALTCKEKVQAFTRDDGCQFDGVTNGKFVLFHQNITGQIKELVENEKIVMAWRAKNWPDNHHSIVTMCFKVQEGGVDLVLEQTGIPATDFERTKEGWKRYYFNPLKITFGFGSKLFF